MHRRRLIALAALALSASCAGESSDDLIARHNAAAAALDKSTSAYLADDVDGTPEEIAAMAGDRIAVVRATFTRWSAVADEMLSELDSGRRQDVEELRDSTDDWITAQEDLVTEMLSCNLARRPEACFSDALAELGPRLASTTRRWQTAKELVHGADLSGK